MPVKEFVGLLMVGVFSKFHLLLGKQIKLKGTFTPGMTLAYFYYTGEDGEHHTAVLTLGVGGSGMQVE